MNEGAVVSEPPEVAWGKQLIKSSLYGHTRFVHGYRMPYHQQVWAAALEDMDIERLLIIAPPKYGKSPAIGIDYLGWRIGRDPENYHCIYLSNTGRQASKYNVALRDTVGHNPNYKWLYGLKPDVNKGWGETEWFVKRKNQADKDPTVQSCGVFGPILGATVNEVILDDVADKENMATEYQRQKLMDWIRSTPMTRLVPGGESRAVMICTRWHEQDPASVFEKEGWVVIQIPAVENLVIGEKDGRPTILAGESTFPEFWNMKSLNTSLHDAGVRDFQMIFQGNVISAAGGIFKKEWWRYWVQGEAPWQIPGERNMPIRAVVESWDTAHKDRQQNDFSVCETWYVLDNAFALVDVWKGKVTFPDLKRAAKALANRDKPNIVLIEDAASGQDLIPELRAETTIPVLPITVDRDKVSRANACTPMIEAGKVLIPRDAPWRQEWEYEHEIFPRGAHDDQVDTTTQFLNWARSHVTSGPSIPTGVAKESQWAEMR